MHNAFRNFHPLFLLLLLAGGVRSAPQNLPDLGIAPDNNSREKHLAEVAKAFGEASQTDNGLSAGQQARQFALGEFRDAVSSEINQEVESWLSPYGNATVNLQANDEGQLTGSQGNWFIPWQDNNRYLSWSQLGLTQQDDGLVSNAGIGQRWVSGNWLLGYNTFYDNQLESHLQRAGLGAEAWGEYLRLSANYYQPLSGWDNDGITLQQRMARGYDITAQARLPFYQHLNTSLSLEQYFGDSVDLFDSGTGYHNPVAVKVGLDYTPVPLVTVTAQHRQGESGVSQNDLGLKLNYRFGVPLKKQLQASEVAQARSLRGSRYDSPTRNNLPVVEYRQRKTLTVFLATPPWDLQPNETVQLKLQVKSEYHIRELVWQGDAQALSLTPPVNPRDPDGWSVIMPAWDPQPGASNRWRLSVTVEDNKGQRVSSNEITLALAEPVQNVPQTDPGWGALPGE